MCRQRNPENFLNELNLLLSFRLELIPRWRGVSHLDPLPPLVPVCSVLLLQLQHSQVLLYHVIPSFLTTFLEWPFWCTLFSYQGPSQHGRQSRGSRGETFFRLRQLSPNFYMKPTLLHSLLFLYIFALWSPKCCNMPSYFFHRRQRPLLS